MALTGQHAELAEADVVDLAHDGRGVARVAGKAVFIAGALPGERVRYRITKRRRALDEAVLVEVLTRSPDRTEPKCAHFGTCGGCSLQHLSTRAQIAAKERQLIETLERIGQVRPPRVFAPIRAADFAYRRRARIGIRYVRKKGRVLAGFRERDKPYIADLARCEILIERFATLPAQLAALVETLSVREQVPQVEVAAGDARAALTFRVMQAPDAPDLQKLEAFGSRLGVDIYLQSGGLDTIRPLKEGPGERPGPLSYAVDEGRINLEFGPSDFIQINREVNQAMVEAAIRHLEPGAKDSVLDLFCGLGNFTLPLGRRTARIVGVEGDPALVAKARANAAANGVAAEFFTANLFEPQGFGRWADKTYDLVLLDPPRAGALAIVERMPQWGPRRVVYISCHPGSLARDTGVLTARGFKLSGAGVMDMFPHTTHVESIAVFERGA